MLKTAFFYISAKKMGIELAGHEVTQPLFHQILKTVPKVERDSSKKTGVKRRGVGG